MDLRSARLCAAPLLCLASLVSGAERSAGIPPGYQLQYEEKFERQSALHDFVMTDPAAWRWTRTNGITALELFRQSQYQPAVRSPANYVIIAEKKYYYLFLEAILM